MLGPCLVCVFLALPSNGGINTLESLDALVGRADLVVAGRVLTLTQISVATVELPGQMPYRTRRMLAAVEVRRILKGQNPGQVVSFEYDTVEDVISQRYTRLAKDQYGIIFLSRGEKRYEIPRGTNGIVIASPSSPLPQGTPLEKVVSEVAYVLLSSTTSDGEKGLAFIVLQGTKTPQVRTVYRQVAASKTGLRYSAMAMLLSWNDLSVLPEVVSILMSDQKEVTIEQRRKLTVSIPYGITDPKAIPLLSELADAADPLSRASALEALGQINDPRVLDPLARGLDDKDQRVRYHAVRGLAKVTGDEIWFGGWESYIKEEKRLLEYWRNWAQTRRGT
jgi:FOG: HEAT repeat